MIREEHETALAYLQQALDIQQETGEQDALGVTLNNISQIYAARGETNGRGASFECAGRAGETFRRGGFGILGVIFC